LLAGPPFCRPGALPRDWRLCVLSQNSAAVPGQYVVASVGEPEPIAKEPKWNCLPEPEPELKLLIAAPAPFYLSKT
jgi:hypothetical protein